MNDYPMKPVFEALDQMGIDFPASGGEATYESPIVLLWSDDIEPYSYAEKMHLFIECWCRVHHKSYVRMTGNQFSKPLPDRRLIDRMSVQIRERDAMDAPVTEIDFVFDISDPFRAKHTNLSEENN